MAQLLYRYVFRGIGIVLLIGMITALFLMINTARHLHSVPPAPAVRTGGRP